MTGRMAVTGAAVTVFLGSSALPAAGARTAGPCSAPTALGIVTCVYDDASVRHHTLRIPTGVHDVRITAHGAAGGAGGTLRSDVAPAPGGPGGMVSATLPVAPGDVLRIVVGGRGQNANGITAGAAGRNGGARGGSGAPAGGGGGGSSDVRLNGTDHSSRVLVAGGGGGAGGTLTRTVASARGGAGGGERGENGGGDYLGPGGIGAVGPIGGAGVDTLAGQDGHDGYDEQYGGAGGEGGYGTSDRIKHSGTWAGGTVGAGGGGGGYAGGGGGAAGATTGGGGGGGSGFVAASRLAGLASAQLLIGEGSTNDGLVVITYQLPVERRDRSETAPLTLVLATSEQRQPSGAR